MRKLIALVALATIMVAAKVDAAESPRCGSGRLGDAIDCGGEVGSGAPGQASTGGVASTGTSTSASTPAKTYVPYDRVVTQPDGQYCVGTGYYEGGPEPPDAARPDPSHGGLYPYVPCPEQPPAPGQPAPAPTPEMIAMRYWERIPLPKPDPAIAPGRAITGKLAYLETRGQTTATYTNTTPFGALEIVARGSYTVDWGDGETSGPYSFEGKAWPDGEITHEYIDVGSYDVVVTERWTATWSFGGQSGTLRALQTVGRIAGFPVEQIQAVVIIGR